MSAKMEIGFDEQWGSEQAWHGDTTIKEVQTLRDNFLSSYDYAVLPLITSAGRTTEFSIAEIGGRTIGRPFNPTTYHFLNNAAFLEFAEKSVLGSGHDLVSSGSFSGRENVYLSFALRGFEEFEIGGRKFKNFLNFGHGVANGRKAFVGLCTNCIVCANTYNYAFAEILNDDEHCNATMRHTKNMPIALDKIAKAVQDSVGIAKQFQLTLQSLEKKRVTEDQVTNFFAGFLGKKSAQATNARNELVRLFREGPGNVGKTRFDVFGAITDRYSHTAAARPDLKDSEDEMKRKRWKNFESSEIGAGADRKRDAYNLLNDDKKFAKMVSTGAALMKN